MVKRHRHEIPQIQPVRLELLAIPLFCSDSFLLCWRPQVFFATCPAGPHRAVFPSAKDCSLDLFLSGSRCVFIFLIRVLQHKGFFNLPVKYSPCNWDSVAYFSPRRLDRGHHTKVLREQVRPRAFVKLCLENSTDFLGESDLTFLSGIPWAKPALLSAMININCQLNIESHHGDRLLGMCIREFLDWTNWGENALNVHDSIAWAECWQGEGERWASANSCKSLLPDCRCNVITCLKLPLPLVLPLPTSPHKLLDQSNSSFLKLLLSGILLLWEK